MILFAAMSDTIPGEPIRRLPGPWPETDQPDPSQLDDFCEREK
jgi:hypothetical protein